MSVENHRKLYTSAALVFAFAAGIVVTLGYNDVFPDLEARYQKRRRLSRASSTILPRRPPVHLEDHTVDDSNDRVAEALPAGVEALIGNTPLIQIKSLSHATGRTILAKVEYLNGCGNSPKDRVALAIIRAAEAAGDLVPNRGDTIYEGTVGSTGISLAALARALGYHAHICMPSDQSMEKVDLLHHLGATVERVPPAPIAESTHFVNLARRRAREHEGLRGDGSKGFFADQFENEANWRAHATGTGREIWQQCSGEVSLT